MTGARGSAWLTGGGELMKGLRDKTVLVTGAASGIGQAVALRFAAEGARLVINYRTSGAETATVAMAQRAGAGGCIAVAADVSREAEVVAMFDTSLAEFGPLDVLVNNAGIQLPAATHESSLDDFNRVVAVDIHGPYLCAREAIKQFLGRGGVIVNISSVHEVIPKPKYLSYSMSKGALGNLTRTLALEYADAGIRVNAVAPGATVTPINRAWIDDAKARAEVESHIPMGRAGEADEIAAAVAFLASDEAAYITGQTLFVDGGLTLYPEFRTPWSSGE